jgi:hypothetical protein
VHKLLRRACAPTGGGRLPDPPRPDVARPAARKPARARSVPPRRVVADGRTASRHHRNPCGSCAVAWSFTAHYYRDRPCPRALPPRSDAINTIRRGRHPAAVEGRCRRCADLSACAPTIMIPPTMDLLSCAGDRRRLGALRVVDRKSAFRVWTQTPKAVSGNDVLLTAASRCLAISRVRSAGRTTSRTAT